MQIPTLGIRQTKARQSRTVSGKVGEVLSRLIEERALGHEMIFRGRVTYRQRGRTVPGQRGRTAERMRGRINESSVEARARCWAP